MSPRSTNDTQVSAYPPFLIPTVCVVLVLGLSVTVGVNFWCRTRARSRQQLQSDAVLAFVQLRSHLSKVHKQYLPTIDDLNTNVPATTYKSWKITHSEKRVKPDQPAVINVPAITTGLSPKCTLPCCPSAVFQPFSTKDPGIGNLETAATLNNAGSYFRPIESVTFMTSSVSITTSDDSCAICLEKMEDDDNVRGLDCAHVFHVACVDNWLSRRRSSCPVCRIVYEFPVATV